jgi:hypothetical protein
VHPEFGPASLAIDEATDKLLSTFAVDARQPNCGAIGMDFKGGAGAANFPDEAREAVSQLKELRILTSNLRTEDHSAPGSLRA